MAAQQFKIFGILVLVLVVISVSVGNCELAEGFDRCDTDSPIEIQNFTISACPQGSLDEPCKLKRGKKVEFKLEFTSSQKFNKLETSIGLKNYGYGDDACQLGVWCPLSAGKKQTLKWKIEVVQQLYPLVQTLEFSLKDPATFKQVACIHLPVKVV